VSQPTGLHWPHKLICSHIGSATLLLRRDNIWEKGFSRDSLTPKRRTYDHGMRLSVDTQFCHLIKLYVGKMESYIFNKWRIVFIMSSKIFMNFVKILKSLWIYEVIVKKIHINYKIYSQTSILLIVCVNHNRQHIDGWKLSMNLKWVSFTTPCSKC
jgi:hypothetical protein